MSTCIRYGCNPTQSGQKKLFALFARFNALKGRKVWRKVITRHASFAVHDFIGSPGWTQIVGRLSWDNPDGSHLPLQGRTRCRWLWRMKNQEASRRAAKVAGKSNQSCKSNRYIRQGFWYWRANPPTGAIMRMANENWLLMTGYCNYKPFLGQSLHAKNLFFTIR